MTRTQRYAPSSSSTTHPPPAPVRCERRAGSGRTRPRRRARPRGRAPDRPRRASVPSSSSSRASSASSAARCSSSASRRRSASSRRSIAAARSSTAPSARRRSSTSASACSDGGLTRVELGRADAQLRLPEIELGSAVAEDLLDPEVQLARALLAALELLDGRADLRRALLELLPALGDQVGDGVGGVGRREEPAKASARLVVGRAAARPLVPFPLVSRVSLHDRVVAGAPAAHPQPSSSNEPPARPPFAAPVPSPARRGRATQPYGGGPESTRRVERAHGCNRRSSPCCPDCGGRPDRKRDRARLGLRYRSFGPATAESSARSRPTVRSSWSGSAASTARSTRVTPRSAPCLRRKPPGTGTVGCLSPVALRTLRRSSSGRAPACAASAQRRAEVERDDPGRLAAEDPAGRGVEHDRQPGLAEEPAEQVRAVTRRGHPRVDDRRGGRRRAGEHGEVLADRPRPGLRDVEPLDRAARTTFRCATRARRTRRSPSRGNAPPPTARARGRGSACAGGVRRVAALTSRSTSSSSDGRPLDGRAGPRRTCRAGRRRERHTRRPRAPRARPQTSGRGASDTLSSTRRRDVFPPIGVSLRAGVAFESSGPRDVG